MNRTIRKIAITAALALPVALVAQVAQATLISSWSYDVESGFTGHSDNGAGGGTGIVESDTNTNNGLPTTLSWGDVGGPSSSIHVEGSVTGNVDTNGAAVSGATFTHNNFTISNTDTTLTQATLQNTLTLDALVPPTGDTESKTFNFVIPFAETPNVAGSCPAGSSGPPCDDVFVLQNPGATSFHFTEQDYLYTVALSISGIGVLSDSACSAAGAASGCVGVLTQEGLVNTIPTSFTITAQQQTTVPEPGALSIMGLGLIGLAFLGFRRNRSEG